ncbi:MAG TPA: glycerophosphodiester phosphodiesterase [Turneriella sp.]|nr:glycerophosphodiester phosphodiesterase [Turneriella sp.]
MVILRERRHQPLSFERYYGNFTPTLASHRGYGKHGPIAENTLPAFMASEKLGFHAHEFDVRKTQDNQVMLLHGPRLEVTSDGVGRMEDTPSAQIQKLDAAHYLLDKTDKRKKHTRVPFPTLEKVLTTLPKNSKLNIEIKRDRWDLSRGVEALTIQVVEKAQSESRVAFSGFHFLTLWYLRRLKTKIPVGLLIEPGIFARAKLFLYRYLLLPDNIHLHYSTATPYLLAKLKKRGYGLAFWTVNDESIARYLFNHGADIVITDNMQLK